MRAVCRLTQVVHNPSSRQVEVEYPIPRPTEGTVAGLVLLADGQELKSEIYSKDEAWRIYREIVSRAQDPALLEYAGQGLFQAHIFPVPAKSRRSLELKFEMLLKKEDGKTSFAFPLAGPLTRGRDIKTQDIDIRLKSSQPLKNIYSPVDMTIKQARNYVEGLRAGGYSNIKGALNTSFKMITDDETPTYILFLTDSQPTAGETREMPLADLTKKLKGGKNSQSARLFSFGIGNDVNARLLDRISGQAGGNGSYGQHGPDRDRIVRPGERQPLGGFQPIGQPDLLL